ncbi:MAG: CoA-binding protein [Nitrosopumilaceae archaeon]|nr:CoA-binding protein [Nitrosopumilaceae archaeon]NIP09364.1 CoA-binding protein [Nitrosopumilaceae archaeon]NIS94594.1 CoA-binding protein [Nitrosopumilaceae archaeon]
MDTDNHTDDEIRKILSLKKITVVGMSQNPGKDAHMVPKYLVKNDYDVTPVNPNTDEILGKKCYNLVSEVPGEIDIVNVFRPSEDVLPVVQEAIKKNPKVIWLQQGIHNPEAENLARQAGIDVVFNRCMFAEHRRLSRS